MGGFNTYFIMNMEEINQNRTMGKYYILGIYHTQSVPKVWLPVGISCSFMKELEDP
jgi:hypothetical protein